MIIFLIYPNVLIFVLLSALHIYWAFGGKWALATSIPISANNKPLFKPSIFSTLLVACGLLIFSIITFSRLNISAFVINQYTNYATLFIAVIFLIRAIGDFKYIGLFKKVNGTPFATNDNKIYIPLCLFLSLSSLLIVIL